MDGFLDRFLFECAHIGYQHIGAGRASVDRACKNFHTLIPGALEKAQERPFL
jgi:hypothetical protein